MSAKKYLLLYGYGEYVNGHEDFKTEEERDAWDSGFSRGCHQHGGEETFTMRPEDVEHERADLAFREAERSDSYYTKMLKARIEDVEKYLNALYAKEAYEGK